MASRTTRRRHTKTKAIVATKSGKVLKSRNPRTTKFNGHYVNLSVADAKKKKDAEDSK